MFGLLNVFFVLFFFFAGIDETVEMIRANGGTCVGYKVDISKKEEVYKAADAIRRDVGDVSVLNNKTTFNHCYTQKLSNNIFEKKACKRTHKHVRTRAMDANK